MTHSRRRPDRLMFVIGTRPEAIKLAPVIHECKSRDLDHRILLTGQHGEMLNEVLDFFNVHAHRNLGILVAGQTLTDLAAAAIAGIAGAIRDFTPSHVIVQGDTTTAMAGALSAFYGKVKVAHVEAGLRTWEKAAPYPEEVNRKIIAQIADFHFAPTSAALANLNQPDIQGCKMVTGNTVIDALLWAEKTVQANIEFQRKWAHLSHRRRILVTAHRRENAGLAMVEICNGVLEITKRFGDVEIVMPLHPNPAASRPAVQLLGKHDRIHLLDPLPYPELIWHLSRSHLVLTDSGGIQEEAPTLGKPVLVMRDVTERIEGIEAGTAELVGTNAQRIADRVTYLLSNSGAYEQVARIQNPYGDGMASARIVEALDSRNVRKCQE